MADHVSLAVANARAYQELENAVQLRDEGVRLTAHELRTPLTAIKGFAQLGLRQLSRNPTDLVRARDALSEINAASDRLMRLIGDMLDTSHIEMGLRRLHKEKRSLRPFLRE